MILAVIIPAYNDLAGVLNALNSLQATQARHEVSIPVHNEELERRVDVLMPTIGRDDPLRFQPTRTEIRLTHRVMYIVQDDASPNVFYPALVPPAVAVTFRNEQNLGFAGNCNAGGRNVLNNVQPDVLLFLNQDVYAVPELSQGWDTALLSAFDDPAVGIVGARLLFPDGKVQNAGGTFDQFAQPVHRCLGWSNLDYHEIATPREVEWTTGAALAVRASVWAELGGFDEGYARGYFEDVDLCLRARETGHKVWYEPGCTLVHTVGTTGGSPYFVQNALRFKQQWVDSGKVKPGTLQPVSRYW